MIRYFFIFFTLIFALLANASGLDEANDLFQHKKVKEAILKYEKYLIENQDVSAYYNLGIAFHENKEHGKAIWAFENVLKMSPNDESAYDQIVQCQHDIDPTNNWSPILGTLESNLYSYSANFWSYLSIVLSVILGLIIITIARKKKNGLLIFFSFTITILIASTIFVARSAYIFSKNQYGIAVVESTLLENKNGHYVPSQKLMLEGSRVLILEDINGEYLSVLDESGDKQFVHKSTIKSF